jgi:uncharacterized delta-60 repeat protein
LPYYLLAGFLASAALIAAPGAFARASAEPGDLDPSFGTAGKVTTDLGGPASSFNDQAFALTIQRDGKIVVGGRASDSAFDVDFALVRYNPDGSLDASFGNGGKVRTDFNGHTLEEIYALMLQPDDKIVAAGRCSPGSSHSCIPVNPPNNPRTFALARYNADGSLDGTFGAGGKVITSFPGSTGDEAYALARQADGKIVAAGLSQSGGLGVARYNTDGILDPSFGNGGLVTTGVGAPPFTARAVAIQTDGKIVLGGTANTTGPSGPSMSIFALVRLNPDGSVDSTFGASGRVLGGSNSSGRAALALQPDGGIVIASSSGAIDFVVDRYNTDGSPDTTFGIGGRVSVNFGCPPCQSATGAALTLQPNGKILVAGWRTFGLSQDFAVMRFNPDGTLDLTFGSEGKVTTNFGAEEMASAMALQADGNIVVAGSSCVLSCLSGKSVFALARYQGGPPSLVAAVLPGSRSVQVGAAATAFASIVAVGGGTATGCGIAPATLIPALFSYQTTDPATNQLMGSPNTPANIASGKVQTFVVAFTPTAALAPTEMHFTFDCANTDPVGTIPDPVGTIPGVNTLLLSASTTPTPDIVALAATPTNDGIVNIPGPNGDAAFAIATVNVGSSSSITVTADTGSVNLPVLLFVCETNPADGQCVTPPTPSTSVTVVINSNATPTFGLFITGHGNVPFDPANNRIIVRFKDAGGVTRGATSVAVRTP